MTVSIDNSIGGMLYVLINAGEVTSSDKKAIREALVSRMNTDKNAKHGRIVRAILGQLQADGIDDPDIKESYLVGSSFYASFQKWVDRNYHFTKGQYVKRDKVKGSSKSVDASEGDDSKALQLTPAGLFAAYKGLSEEARKAFDAEYKAYHSAK